MLKHYGADCDPRLLMEYGGSRGYWVNAVVDSQMTYGLMVWDKPVRYTAGPSDIPQGDNGDRYSCPTDVMFKNVTDISDLDYVDRLKRVQQYYDDGWTVLVETRKWSYVKNDWITHWVIIRSYEPDDDAGTAYVSYACKFKLMDSYYEKTQGTMYLKDYPHLNKVMGIRLYRPVFTPGKISGYKWEDTNTDGNWDAGELGLPNWTIQLLKDGQVIDTRTTLSDGSYRFTDLAAGTYEVREVLQDGWKRKCPESGSYFVTVVSGTDSQNNNFGNYVPGKISGYKWEDMDENRAWDKDEPAKAGWSIKLTGDGKDRTTTTNDQGYYEFTDLVAGDYAVTEDCPAGWVKTCPSANGYIITVISRTDSRNNDFGNFQLGRISAIKFDDSDVSGSKDEGENLLKDWEIVLYKNGQAYATGTTDDEGKVTFDGLHHGTYAIYERAQKGWRQTCPFPGATELVNPGDLGLGLRDNMLIESNSQYLDNKFGNVAPDFLVKGVYHYWWEEPIKDITVHLDEIDVPGVLENVPALPWQSATSELGTVRFDELLPGKYKITIDLPAGWCEEPAQEYDTAFVKEHGNGTQVADYIYDGSSRVPRTMGFWQNWRNKYTPQQMEAMIVRVKAGSQDFSTLSLATIDSLIRPRTPGKVTMPDMARMQYLALWLNLASDKLGFTPIVNISGIQDWRTVVTDTYYQDDGIMTVHYLMQQLRTQYNSGTMTGTQQEVFKNICEALNSYACFTQPPTGPID